MSQILAFDVYINGEKRSIDSLDSIRRAVLDVNKALANTKFNTPEFNRASATLTNLQDAYRILATEQKKASTSALQAGIDTSTSMRQMEARIGVLREVYRGFTEAERKSPIGKATITEIRSLDGELNKIQSKLGTFKNNLASVLKSQGSQVAGAVGGILTQQLGSQGGIAQSLIGGVLGGGVSALTGNVTLGIAQIGGAFIEAGAKAVAFNAEVSDALANVAKTTNLTKGELNSLVDDLKNLDTRTGLIDLLKIGEVLGQLGLEVNTASIAAVDKLNVALSDEFAGNTQDIVDNVGQLRNLFKDIKSQNQADDFLKIGNALNYLGATGLATAPIVSDFSVRIAGTVGPLGIAAKEILGVSAALQELGTSPERGASGFARSIRQLTQTPELFIKTLQLTGDTVERLTNGQYKSFTKFVQNDLFGAYKLVIQRLKEMNLSNIGLSRTLDAVKISGVGEVEVIGKLIEGYGLMIERVNDSGYALSNLDSVTKEFTKKNVTLGAELQKLGNNIAEAFVNSELSDSIAQNIGSINKMFTATVDLNDVLAKNNLETNNAVISVLNLEQSDRKRIDAIRALQAQYPELLGSLSAEKVSNEDLLKVLAKVNDEYQLRRLTTDSIIQFQKSGAKANNLSNFTKEREVNLVNALSKAYSQYTYQLGGVALNGATIIENAKKVNDILKQQGINYSDLDAAIVKYDYANNLSVQADKELVLSKRAANEEIQRFNSSLITTPLNLRKEIEQRILSVGALKAETDQLVKQGKVRQAQLLIAKSSVETNALLKKLSSANLKDAKALTGLDPATFAQGVDDAADRLRKLNTLLENSTKTVDGKKVLNSDTVKKIGISKKEFAKALEDETQYYNDRNKLVADSIALRTKNTVDGIQDAKDKELAAEDLRFAETAEKFKDNIDKLVELQNKETQRIKQLLSDIQEKKLQTAKGSKAYTTLVDQEKQLQDELKRLNEQFLIDRATLGDEFNKNLEAATSVHNKNIIDIDEKYAKLRLEAIKKRQKALFDTLEEIRDKEDVSIVDRSAKVDAKIQAEREKAINAAKSTLTGDSLETELKKIDIKFDLQDFDNQKAELLQKIKILEQEINTAGGLNSAFGSIGLPPVISQEDINKLVKQKAALTKQLTNVDQKEQNYIDKNEADIQQKRLQKQKEYRNQLTNIFIDGLKKLNDAQAELETKELERSINKRKALIDDEYKYRLEHAKNNTIETERLEKQKAARLEKLNEEQFERQKEIDIKRAEIDAALSIIKAYATLDPISASIAAIGIGIETAILIDKIRSQKLAVGGFTGKSRYGKDDTGERPVDATVHEDEFVVRRKVVNDPIGRMYVNRLDRMNKGLPVNHSKMFAEGGFISRVQSIADKNTIVYVTASITDEQLTKLANSIVNANSKSVSEAIVNGLDTSNRLKERNTELTNRTNL